MPGTLPPNPCTSWPCKHVRPCPLHDVTTDHDRHLERARNKRRARSLAVYRSPAWRHLSARILRERPTCERPRCFQPSEQVDHVIAIEDGGEPFDESNLEALCAPCHSRKTAVDVAARKARSEGEGSQDRVDPGARDRRRGA